MSPDAPTPEFEATTDVPLLAGRYQILEKLGQGGMGAVFRARDAKLDRHVAVKVLPPGSVHDTEAVARFQREARALARLSHPGIIQAHDSGEDGARHFLVMELVAGHSLARGLADRGRISPTRAADLGHQAALALHHAHQHGLIHRDVKPSNLLLAPDGRVKLLDLGLARFLQDQVGDAGLTREGAGMGTPDYAAPEQFRDAHRADPRSDIYSLGCTLYHLIAGRVPFPGSSMSEKLQAHETREPPPLAELCPDMPGGLALIVERMMAKRPADRFQTMAEVAEALGPYAATSSASFRELRNTSTWEGSRLATLPAMPRRRARVAGLVAGVAAALVLIAAGVVGITAGWFRPAVPEVAAPAATGQSQPPDTPAKPTDDPNVLTVSQQPEGGGRYRTIGAALETVRAGQTVRVVDAATYREQVLLNRASAHAGVTLESPRGATLAMSINRTAVIEVGGVTGVTIRGFLLRASGTDLCSLVYVHGQGAGVLLERLDTGPVPEGGVYNGVEVQELAADSGRPSLVVRDCVFRKAQIGINLIGIQGDYSRPTPVQGVRVCDNEFVDCGWGVTLKGSLQHVQVLGNRFRGCVRAACQLEQLLDDTADVLIANNTVLECNNSLRVWDAKIRTSGVRYQNNLSLSTVYPDMLFFDSGGSPVNNKGFGDGTSIPERWGFRNNWREAKRPAKTPAEPDGWIPPGKGDVLTDRIDGVNRDPTAPDFLRPGAKSPLAAAGAGTEDPLLPAYVGALPPEGTGPWDWDRTWRVRVRTTEDKK